MPPRLAMTVRPAPSPASDVDATDVDASDVTSSASNTDFTSSWEKIRENADIQFAPVELPKQAPREPGWLDSFLKALADIFGFLFGWVPYASPVLFWGMIGIIALCVLFLLYRMFEPFLGDGASSDEEYVESDWQPDREASIALLEDADRLAAQGRYDEATHLLLQRSVTHLSDARPDWVAPSSTARELASLRELPDKARTTFGVIAERVERSLFALRALNKADWEEARAAYADFALTSLKGGAV